MNYISSTFSLSNLDLSNTYNLEVSPVSIGEIKELLKAGKITSLIESSYTANNIAEYLGVAVPLGRRMDELHDGDVLYAVRALQINRRTGISKFRISKIKIKESE